MTVMGMGMGVAQSATWRAARVRGPGGGEEAGGAAKTSLWARLRQDALRQCQASQCEKAAADKKLARAAKNSFVQKVREDGTGPPQGDPVRGRQRTKLAGAARTALSEVTSRPPEPFEALKSTQVRGGRERGPGPLLCCDGGEGQPSPPVCPAIGPGGELT